MVKRNIRDYRKERKEKVYKAKTTSRMRGMIHKMYTEGQTEEQLTPIMHLAQALEEASDDDEYDSDDSQSSNE